MRVFGSLNNRMMEDVQSPAPVVGSGATVLMYSDRHAATVVEVLSPARVVIQEDTATRTDKNGQSESQEYAYTPNPNAPRQIVSLRKDKRWKIAKSNTVVRFGERDAYHDYSF